MPHSERIEFANNVALTLAHSGESFEGLAEVVVDGVSLRSPRRPMFVEIRTPDGIEFLNCRVVESREEADGFELEMEMDERAGGIMEWMVHEVRNRYNTGDWSVGPSPAENTRLSLQLRPLSRELKGFAGKGFSYRYHYRSENHPIYKILDRGTWEVHGEAVGNEIWMRHGGKPVFPIESTDQWYSTEWYLPSCANPNVFQFLPLQTHLQGFTFTRSDAGVLVTWAPVASHVRTLVEKQRHSHEIAHFHEHCGDLAKDFAAGPMEVLWFPGRLGRVEAANLYEAVKEMVHETLHRQIGMRRERATTYGIIEEWNDADLVRYREKGLPKLLEAGCKTIFVDNHFQNNMNTYGVSNMCCTVDYKVAETVGEDNLRDFCRTAADGGARVEMWGNTALSTLSVILAQRNGRPKRVDFLPLEGSVMDALDDSKDPFVRNPSNAIEADHYTPVFAVLNLRDQVVRKCWLDAWRTAHDEIGLGGIFLDSSFNLSSDKFHWIANNAPGKGHGGTIDQTHLLEDVRPEHEPPSAIHSQYHAHLSLMSETQKLGYTYCGEDLGVFGVSRTGPGVTQRLGNMHMWSDCLATFDAAALAEAGVDPRDIFFQGLAYRMMWKLCWDIRADRLSFFEESSERPEERPEEWHLEYLRAYNEVVDLMTDRTILPAEKGVLYRHGDAAVLWALESFAYKLSMPVNIRQLPDGTECEAENQLGAKKHTVYVLRPVS